jgi:hypothetical protein
MVKGGQRAKQSAEERTRWLLKFTVPDLSAISQSERGTIEHELSLYLKSGGVDRRPPFPEGELEACQRWLKDGLDELAKRGAWAIQLGQVPRWLVSLKTQRVSRITGLNGPLTPFFKEVVLADATPIFLRKLGFCQRRGCGAPFIRRKRQAYCKPKHREAERQERYRERNPERAKELRRQSYVRKVHREHPRAKIRRRAKR